MAEMRNPALDELAPFIGEWRQTVSAAPFLADPAATLTGTVAFSWLDGGFLVMRSEFAGGGPPRSTAVIGRNQWEPGYSVLYYDERGVSRIFAMTFDAGRWTLQREDPDFYQRYVGTVSGDRVEGAWQQSHDQGATWEHDFNLTFER